MGELVLQHDLDFALFTKTSQQVFVINCWAFEFQTPTNIRISCGFSLCIPLKAVRNPTQGLDHSTIRF
jgi:hypothetical protein